MDTRAVELMSSWTAKEEKKYNPQQLVELTLLAAAEFEKWVMRDESKGWGNTADKMVHGVWAY